jgi:hypothetical protein
MSTTEVYQYLYDSGYTDSGSDQAAIKALLMIDGGYTESRANAVASDYRQNQYTKLVEADQQSNASTDSGYNQSYFTAAMKSISSSLAQGKESQAMAAVDSLWSKLSQEQKEAVQKLLAAYNLSASGV